MWEIKTSEIFSLISHKISNIEEPYSLFMSNISLLSKLLTTLNSKLFSQSKKFHVLHFLCILPVQCFQLFPYFSFDPNFVDDSDWVLTELYCQDLPSVGSTLSLENVRREEAGLYQCLASNGVEDADQEIYAVIKLTVHCKLYLSQRAEPEIQS